MKGIQFVREIHLSIAEGCFLPRADLFGHIQSHLHEILFRHPDLKKYLPYLLEVDLFVSWDEDKFILFVSPQKRAHLPTRGMESTYLPSQREAGKDLLRNLNGFEDISDLEIAKKTFAQLGFENGFAAAGSFPASSHSDEAKAAKELAGTEIAKLIHKWAKKRQHDMENSCIFLSHKGINKPLIDKIDIALRQLNLKTWFDRDDLAAGDPLVRSVDNAFANCAAAVFFISAEYIDAGVIKREIDRAIHENAMRSDSFRIIPLVLAQHGGNDTNVPAPLQTLVWKTVNDIEIVPAILRSLPDNVKEMIKYLPIK